MVARKDSLEIGETLLKWNVRTAFESGHKLRQVKTELHLSMHLQLERKDEPIQTRLHQ